MKEVLLIDLGSVYWAAWHSSVNDEVSMAHDRCVEHVRKLAGELRNVAICCDSPRSIRREKHVEYKAQRPEKDHASIEELKRAKETLRRDGFLIWEHEGYEADDVIASAVRAAPSDCAVMIASADKDLLQLVYDKGPETERVHVVSTKTGTVYDCEGVRQKLGVPPGCARDWLALVGDKSDNVAGVPGIGAIKAAALLNEFGTIEYMLDRLQNNVTHDLFKPAIVTALRDPANLKNLATAQYLVTLIETLPVEFDEIFAERKPQPLGTPDADFDDEAPPASERPRANPQQALATTEPMPTVEGSGGYSEDDNATARREISRAQTEARLIVSSIPYEQQLQPDNLTAAWKLSGALYDSRLYHRFGTRAAIFAVIIRGREMGLTALTSLDMFHVVEGKPSASAVLLISRAKAHPDCEYFRFIGGDRTYAEYETKNRQNPEPIRFRYTIDDARLAGVVKSGSNWEKRPAEMLRKTAAVQLARIEYPEALGGLYSQEELAA